MKKFLLTILCLALTTSGLSLAQTIIDKDMTVYAKDDPQYSHTIAVSYPTSNQAEIRDLNLVIVNRQSNNPKLKISARVKNNLPRDLINAQFMVELLNEEGSLATAQKKILPPSIEEDERSRAIVLELDYSEDITKCVIDITWLGKDE